VNASGRGTARAKPNAPTALPGFSEAKLQVLREQVEIFEARLRSSPAQMVPPVRHRMEILRDALDRLETKLDAIPDVRPAARESVRLEANAVRAALKPFDVKNLSALDARRRGLLEACADLEGGLGRALGAASGQMDTHLRRYHRAREALHVELKITSGCRQLTTGLRGHALEERRREIAAQIATLKRRLEKSRARLAARRTQLTSDWRALNTALRVEAAAVAAALERLLHPEKVGGQQGDV